MIDQMIIPPSLHTQFKTINKFISNYRQCYDIEKRTLSVKFIDDFSPPPPPPTHSINLQSVPTEFTDCEVFNDFMIITIRFKLHLARFIQISTQFLIKDFVYDFFHTISIFYFLVTFKAIEIYYEQILYNKKRKHSVFIISITFHFGILFRRSWVMLWFIYKCGKPMSAGLVYKTKAHSAMARYL